MGHIVPKKMLIVKNRAMGDTVMGLSAVQYAKALFPEMHIIYGVPKWVAPLFKNVETAADEIWPIELKNLKDFLQFWMKLKKEKIDNVHELFQSGRTAKLFSFYSWTSPAQYKFHNHHINAKSTVHDHGIIKSNIQRDLDGFWSHWCSSKQPVPQYLQHSPRMKINGEKTSLIIFGVVATRDTKKWPLKFFRELAELIHQRNSQTKIIIPLGPQDKESEIAKEFHSIPNCVIIKDSLEKLPQTLSSACLYIGNDTGLKHICVALGVKTYTMFGPEPPREWHPYDPAIHPYFYREGLECRTRDSHFCGLSKCDSMVCLNEIYAKKVYQRIQEDLL